VQRLGRVVAATSAAAAAMLTARVLLDPDPDVARQTVRLWAFATVALATSGAVVGLTRQRAYRRGHGVVNTVIVGAGSIGQLVARRLQAHPELGFRPVGFLDKDPLVMDEPLDSRLPVLGASWDLEEVIEQQSAGQVILAFSTAPHLVLLDIVRRCRRLGVEVSVVPRLFEEVTHRVEVDHLGGIALLRPQYVALGDWRFALKHVIDRVAAAVLLLVLAPLLAVIAVAVRLSTHGSALFRQPRIGRDGHEFDMLKFRTMNGSVAEFGEADAAWAARQINGKVVVLPVPDRRTALGRFLRRWSLDELPQLLNVVKGDMSLVGPRPERSCYARAFEQDIYRYADRYRVKSGITGWAQINGLRGETSLTDRIEWDNYYIENWSLWLDLEVLVRSVAAVFRRHELAR
jgi:exopolysaccharide biosynthesis polyprenyl glycosylphosphotransferase